MAVNRDKEVGFHKYLFSKLCQNSYNFKNVNFIKNQPITKGVTPSRKEQTL